MLHHLEDPDGEREDKDSLNRKNEGEREREGRKEGDRESGKDIWSALQEGNDDKRPVKHQNPQLREGSVSLAAFHICVNPLNRTESQPHKEREDSMRGREGDEP